MKRSEFAEELDAVSEGSNAAVNRLLTYFDEVQRELGYVAALRRNLSDTVDQNVDLEIEVQSLRRKLAAATGTGWDEEGDDDN